MAGVITLTSGKGGTGKSTMSVFIGTALCQLSKKVLLIELDAGLRSIDIISGVSTKTVYDLDDVLKGVCPIENAIVKSDNHHGLNIISAPYKDGSITKDGLSRIIQSIQSNYDYIIIDTAAGLGCAFKIACTLSNMVIMVVTPDPIAVRDAAIVALELDNMGAKNTRLLLNKVLIPRQGKNPIGDLDFCIDEIGVQLIGVVTNSPEIYSCSCSGNSLTDDSVEYEIFKRIAFRICGEYIPLIFETR